KRRLDQIGLVSEVDGAGLMTALWPGQRLVTLDGAMWRWDGFIAAVDAPTAAAQRLAQRNRLAELDDEIVRAKAERNAYRRDVDAQGERLDVARQAERMRREDWRKAQHAIGVAQIEVDAALKAQGEVATRHSALEEAETRLRSNLEEAEAIRDEAITALEDLGD